MGTTFHQSFKISPEYIFILQTNYNRTMLYSIFQHYAKNGQSLVMFYIRYR